MHTYQWLQKGLEYKVELYGEIIACQQHKNENKNINPLNPNIKIQILFCYPYAFSIEVVGRICWSIN